MKTNKFVVAVVAFMLLSVASLLWAQSSRWHAVELPEGTWVVTVDSNGNATHRPIKRSVLSGTPITPTDPTDPVTEPTDQLGLKAFAESQVKAVADYSNKHRDAARIAAGYDTIVGLIDEGKFGPLTGSGADVVEAMDFTLKRIMRAGVLPANRVDAEKWQPVIDAFNGKFKELDLRSVGQLRQAYAEVTFGLAVEPSAMASESMSVEGPLSPRQILGSPAFGDGVFLKWLIETLLPLILQLIGTFS